MSAESNSGRRGRVRAAVAVAVAFVVVAFAAVAVAGGGYTEAAIDDGVLAIVALGRAHPVPAPVVRRSSGSHKPIIAPAIAKNCDDWPHAEVATVFESLGVDVAAMGWRCLDATRAERLERERSGSARGGAELSPADCRAWCFEQHPRELFLKADDAAGWCCEWRPDNAGECAWSDGVARFTPTSSSCERRDAEADQPCVRSLAFNLCELAPGFRALKDGRCLRRSDAIIGRFDAESRNFCSVLCAQQAENAVSGELACTGFAYLKPGVRQTDAMELTRWRINPPPCVLLARCKTRARADRTYDFFVRPEAL
ncbi:hypothetical protein KFE25_003766 [Diacronema lutheri]|uniref:Uncharacterized protein n=2 Tax=Diacronema lutheri TaxID=2081491 RepID=A0A8J6C007_DIALT|nr:hypothetical protein KFE25_003766 [Diacronema lutheri]